MSSKQQETTETMQQDTTATRKRSTSVKNGRGNAQTRSVSQVVTSTPSAKQTKTKSKKKTQKRPKSQTRKATKTNSSTTKKQQSNAENSENKTGEVPKPKKVRNTAYQASNYETQGISIGPARVKTVLTMVSLNPLEYEVKNLVTEAEGRPKKPKPTKDGQPAPEVKQPTPVPMRNLMAERTNVRDVLNRANALHENLMRERYERHVLASMTEAKQKLYKEEKRKAQASAKRENSTFELRKFNETFDPTFYHNESKFKADTREQEMLRKYESNYLTNLKKNDENAYTRYQSDYKLARAKNNFDLHKFNVSFDKNFYKDFNRFKNDTNEWAEARDLISKLFIRVSVSTRYVLAAFLDQMILQYVSNAMKNCLEEGKKIVRISHALKSASGNLVKEVPLDPFARTLQAYQEAVNWEAAMARYRATRTTNPDQKEPEYFNPSYEPSFEGYVVDICRYVKNQMNKGKTTEVKVSNSREFKKFCSYLVYETILRIGNNIRAKVNSGSTKTVNEQLIRDVITDLHTICGVDHESTFKSINHALRVSREYKRASREEEKNDTSNQNTAANDTVINEAELEEEEEEDDGEKVNYE